MVNEEAKNRVISTLATEGFSYHLEINCYNEERLIITAEQVVIPSPNEKDARFYLFRKGVTNCNPSFISLNDVQIASFSFSQEQAA